MPREITRRKIIKVPDNGWKSRAKLIKELVARWVEWLGLDKYVFELSLEGSENPRFQEGNKNSCVAYIEIHNYRNIHIVIKDIPDAKPAYWEEVVVHELIHLLIADLMGGTRAVMVAHPNTKTIFRAEDEELTQALEMAICDALAFYRKPP